MAKKKNIDMIDKPLREVLGKNGAIANWDRKDGYAFLIMRGANAVGLSRFLEASDVLPWEAEDPKELAQAVAVTAGKLAAEAGLDAEAILSSTQEGFDELAWLQEAVDDAE